MTIPSGGGKIELDKIEIKKRENFLRKHRENSKEAVRYVPAKNEHSRLQRTAVGIG